MYYAMMLLQASPDDVVREIAALSPTPFFHVGGDEVRKLGEAEYAQLLEDDVPAAPIYSGLDGGMNEVFLARFPGRVTLAKVLPYASYLPQLPPIPWVDNDGSLTSKWFGTLF